MNEVVPNHFSFDTQTKILKDEKKCLNFWTHYRYNPVRKHDCNDKLNVHKPQFQSQ